MSGIQLVLLTGIAFITLYFIIQLKKQLIDLGLLFLLIAAAVVFIVWPESTNILAHKLGVGRGADLIFYVSILLFWFIVLKLYARLRRLEKTVTQFIREEAIKKAEEPR